VYYAGDSGAALDKSGWFFRNSGVRTHPVGQKLPNDWGLYDMLGNVWQWCEDAYTPYKAEEAVDPLGPPADAKDLDRVMRGGSFFNDLSSCRCASRFKMQMNTPASFCGFRIVRSLE
jgi:formylglycine-generating enzyme required for sulfatase activity